MERESFEDEDIARLMNQTCINIKVDREERPDVDAIYMAAVQAMSGHGGWPMSVFLTPEGRPFYGGTYYPPNDSRGMAGFPRVLDAIGRAWSQRRAELVEHAAELTRRLEEIGRVEASEDELNLALIEDAARHLARAFEPRYGGFGSAPKFPHPMDLRLLLRHASRTGDTHSLHIVRHTLDHMARGGIYDHLGGGFARYSTDEEWLVPHFEKMLYDNALLGMTYLEAFQVTAQPEFARVARETLDYVLNRMTDELGGVYSTEDADSEGVEGKFYVWTLDELTEVLGPERARVFASVYDVSEGGNWEDHAILNMPLPIAESARMLGRDAVELRSDLDGMRAELLTARDRRVAPGKDTKVLTSWNGLMIGTWSVGGRVLNEPRYLKAAKCAAAFVLDQMRQPDGRLFHTWKDAQAKINAFLDDYANLIDGLTRLFEASGEPRWLSAALELVNVMIGEFADPVDGGFFFTGMSHEALIARQKDAYDNATPSATGMAATSLIRLGILTGREDLTRLGRETLQSVRFVMERAPTAAGQALIALDVLLGPAREIVVIGGDDTEEFDLALNRIASRFLPRAVVAPLPKGVDSATSSLLTPLFDDRTARRGRTTIYVCEGFACKAPVGVDGLDEVMRR
jgi:uncharacterized protein